MLDLTVAATLLPDAQLSVCRTVARTELDLVIEQDQRKVGVEITFSFLAGAARPANRSVCVIAPVSPRYPLAERVEVLAVAEPSTLLE